MKQCAKPSFWDTKNVTRLIAVFLMFFAFKAEAQNNALNFNGYNDNNPSGVQNKVVCGNSIGNFGTSNFTIEFNVKTTSTDGNAEWLVTKRSVCGHASFFNIGITNGIVYLEIDQDTNGTNHNDLISNTAVNDGTWHHVALVRSGTSLTFYIDGVASGSKTNSFITNVNNADNLTLGGFGSTCSTNQNFVGSLDELRIWNVARTQSQIQATKNTELVGNETGLITYYNFNQGTANGNNTNSTTLLDKTANANNGTLNNFNRTGTASNWVNGNSAVAAASTINNALHFNGYNNTNPNGFQNKVTCGNSIGNFGTSNFTIEFYIKTTASDSNAEWLVTKRSVCGHASFFNVGITNGIVYLEIDQDTNGTNHNDLVSSTAVNDGTWHHVAFVRSGTSLTFYIDGVASGSKTDSFITNVNNADNLTIGGFGSTCSTNQNFVGSLDELRIWNVARTQSQIQDNMINELTGTETGLITYYNFNQGSANASNTGVTTLNDLTSNQNNGTLSNFALSGTTSNWVSVIKTTVAGIVSANQTITSLTGTGVTTVSGDKSLNNGDWIPVSPSMSWGPMPWEQMPGYNEAQSFKASTSASWTGLKINVKNVNQPGDFTLQIFSGDGVYGNTILSQTVSIYNNGFNNFTFSSPIAITAGQFYTFQLSSNGNADVSIDGSGSSLPFGTFYQNGYGNGGALYFENTYQINNANWNNLTLTGNNGDVLYWQRSADASFSNPITIASTSTTLYSSSIGNLSATTYFRAIVKYGGDAAANTNTVKITVSINTSNTSQITANQCGVTLATLDANINADYVPNYQAYRFEVSNGGSVNTVDVNKYNFSLTQIPGITYGTTYMVRVAVKMGGVWGAYGAACTITTPVLSSNSIPKTAITASFCGATLTALDTKIGATPISMATGYRFEITAAGVTTVYNATTYNFRLSDVGVAAYGTSYAIRVAALVNGVYGNYGTSCSISTPTLSTSTIPTTSVIPSYCGTTLATLDTKIGAIPVTAASGYRFEITTAGGTTVYDSSLYNFRLADTGVAAYGTTYAIRVAVKINGVWGAYGAACTVTTPVLNSNSIPLTKLLPAFCGATLAALDTKIGAVIVAGATKGRFEVTIAGGSPVVYEVAAYNFKLSQTGVPVLYNTNYAIRVAAYVNGVWGNYGISCTVTTPAATAPARLKAKSFEVAAYPNPFDTAFNLNLETPSKEEVTIAVYDMMGKLVETHQVNPMEVANLAIGTNFAAGMYNVIVSQANEMQALRLIRK